VGWARRKRWAGEKRREAGRRVGKRKGPGGCGLGRLGFGFYFLFQNCFEILCETCSYKKLNFEYKDGERERGKQLCRHCQNILYPK
jgi:hypothetical protein